MDGANLDELRELSRRTKRAHAWGAYAIIGGLFLYPLVGTLVDYAPQWSTWWVLGVLSIGGALLLRFAYVAGEARGAFRRVYRRIADDRKKMAAATAPAQPSSS